MISFSTKVVQSSLFEEDDRPVADDPGTITPGTIITEEPSFMRGRGISIEKNRILRSTVVGRLERVEMLLTMHPERFRYRGEIGDVVVGRIIEVQHKRWLVDVNARLNGILLLTSLNLPYGERRRKTEEDQLTMRNLLDVGDLVSAEVQSIFSDGSLSVHTRTLKFGKLNQGQLVKVPPAFMRRTKTHFHKCVPGVRMILSNNGYIWLSPLCALEVEEASGGYTAYSEPIALEDRESIARVRNCIMALVDNKKMLCDSSIFYAYKASLPYEIHDILEPNVKKAIADYVSQRVIY